MRKAKPCKFCGSSLRKIGVKFQRPFCELCPWVQAVLENWKSVGERTEAYGFFATWYWDLK